jgi:hypothetical protein
MARCFRASAERPLLPKLHKAEGDTEHPRAGSECGPRFGRNRSLRGDQASSKESRDGIRPPQTHPAHGPIEITRTNWRSGRVYARRSRSKPSQNGQTDAVTANGVKGNWRLERPNTQHRVIGQVKAASCRCAGSDFCNTIGHKRPSTSLAKRPVGARVDLEQLSSSEKILDQGDVPDHSQQLMTDLS